MARNKPAPPNKKALCKTIAQAPFGYVPEWFFSPAEFQAIARYTVRLEQQELIAIAPHVAIFMQGFVYALNDAGKRYAARKK